MAKDYERIEAEIEAAREQLAATLDELALRANPKRIAANTKVAVKNKVNEPKVKYTLIGVGSLLTVLIVVKIVRK
ncbi:DUF3618 domain-containing protein [Smaragdicoccus niigatensis]|uniref:DUF3618 domain-containing protein n=1 Tax=Smaragdicoccus niigatensis TaxID=359359 RepID=UPI00035C4F15|nr:DUF3618 domain-containing protein [Smaragdicoccus niigatensis]